MGAGRSTLSPPTLPILLFELLHGELLRNEILYADETTLQVLHEDGRNANQKSCLWPYGTSGDAKRPVVLYDYQPSRAGECASKFSDGFVGKLYTDVYDAYHCKLPPSIAVVGYWAHLRRKFTDAIKSLPPDIQSKSPAEVGLAYCNKLFGLEANYAKQELTFEERRRTQEEKSKSIAKTFFDWAQKEYDKNTAQKTTCGATLTYTANQKSWLMNVFLDGRLELSDNLAERSVLPFAIGKKTDCFATRRMMSMPAQPFTPSLKQQKPMD